MQTSDTVGQIDALHHDQPEHHEAIESSTTTREESGDVASVMLKLEANSDPR